jgi:hypothetical protein
MKPLSYKNLATIINIFKGKPNQLAKYLIDSGAITDDFLKKIDNKEVSQNNSKGEIIVFSDFNSVKEHYVDLVSEILSENEDTALLEIELNDKLDELIKLEKYEEAIELRDYMNDNNFKRKSNNF